MSDPVGEEIDGGRIWTVSWDILAQRLGNGKQRLKVRARSIFCFWAVKELGMSLRELARHLEISPPAVGYCVERGETIARENGYRVME